MCKMPFIRREAHFYIIIMNIIGINYELLLVLWIINTQGFCWPFRA